MRCSWPLGGCSPVCVPGVLCLRCLWPLRAFLRVCAVTLAPCRLFTGVWAWCVPCAVSVATWHFFSGVHAWCAACAVSFATWLLCVRGLFVVWSAAACCAFVCQLWFLCALGVLASPMLSFFVAYDPWGGRGSLAPGPLPWLWPAACLSCLPRAPRWCAAPHSVWLLSLC